MPKIAITGTIASGKSMLSQYLRNKGYFVLDLDRVNAGLLNNSDVLKEISSYFPECFSKDLDKKKLAFIIFHDPLQKRVLESILFPKIKKIMFEEMEKHSLFFCEVPLLFESGFDAFFDESWLVVADNDTSLTRLMAKGYSESEALSRIKNQMPLEEKKKRATKIIYNKTTFAHFYEQIEKALSELNAGK